VKLLPCHMLSYEVIPPAEDKALNGSWWARSGML